MGCSTCSKCTFVRTSAFCGRTKLTQKQLHNKNGFCSGYEPRKITKELGIEGCDSYAEIDAIVREAYNAVNKDYLREQSISALVSSGKNREEAEEWLNKCEISVNG